MSPPADALWSLASVTLGRRLVDVTLQVGPGVTAVLGPSGAGKTSLLELLVGFENAEGGTIGFTPAPGAPLDLFWSPADGGLWPHLDVRQHLALVQPDGAEVARLLAAFALVGCATARPPALSAGERDRTALARAVASGARALVLDEPLAHVDRATAALCWAALAEHVAAHTVSVVFATHDGAVALAEAERAICLHEGQPRFVGTIRELWKRPPSAELALALGPATWLSPAQSARWLGETVAGTGVAMRPHQLDVLPDDAGGLVVVRSRTRGDVHTASLREADGGAELVVAHLRAVAPLVEGMRVRLARAGAG